MMDEFKIKMRLKEQLPPPINNIQHNNKCPKEQIIRLSKNHNLKELYLPELENEQGKRKRRTLRNNPILKSFRTLTGIMFDTRATINSDIFK